MATFFTSKNGLLTSIGHAPDGTEQEHAAAGEICTLGQPPGFTPGPPPYAGACWHVLYQRWVDPRTSIERRTATENEVLAARKAAYPPLADLADALYWQAQGDNTKMDAYHAAIAAVKAQYPKI